MANDFNLDGRNAAGAMLDKYSSSRGGDNQASLDPVGSGGRGPGGSVPGANTAFSNDKRKKPDDIEPYYRSNKQVLDIKNNLIRQYAVRDYLYRFLQRVYDGDFWRQVSDDIASFKLKYHLKRYKTDLSYRFVVNYIFAAVNDYVDLLSKEPSIHVPPLHAADSLSQDQAAQNEKILYGIWENSKMSKQMYDFSWYLALLGSAVLESTLDVETNIPNIIVQHPGTHYIRERFGRPNEILYGIQRAFLEPAQVEDAYGGSWHNNGRYSKLDTQTGVWTQSDEWIPNMSRIEVIIFYSSWERVVLIQDQVVNDFSVQYDEPIEVPFRVVHFLKRPGKAYGIGAAEQSWALNSYLNQLYSQEANILAYAANPILVVKEPTQVPEDIPNDPGSVISTGPQGSVTWLQWHGSVPELTQQMERTRKYIQDVQGLPESRYGAAKQSFLTGRAVDQLNAPTQDRIASRLRGMGEELQHINRIALWQFEHASYGKTVELYGQSGEGDSFALRVKGKDVNGYYRNFVTWDNHDHGDAVEILQLYGAGLVDRRSAIVALGLKEPDQIIKRIRQDKEEDIEITRLYEEAKLVTIAPVETEGLIPGQSAILGPAGQEQLEAGLASGGQVAPVAPGGPPQGGGIGGPPAAQGPQPVQGGPGAPTGTPPPALPQGLPTRTMADHAKDLHTLRGGNVPMPPNPQGPASTLAGIGGPPGGLPPASPASRPGGFGPDPGLAAPSRVRKGFGPGNNLFQGDSSKGVFGLQMVANDIRALSPDKLKGRVWLKGDILGGAAQKIDVFLSAAIDKKTLIDSLPQYKGQLVFEKGKTPPAAAIEVTPKPFEAPPGPGNVASGHQPDVLPTGATIDSTHAAGVRKNPPGLIGPTAGPGGVPLASYQQVPMPPPGLGPLPNSNIETGTKG